jgi:hypothetical protein
MSRKRVVVVVNKWWECDPAMLVLLDPRTASSKLHWPARLNHPHQQPDVGDPPGFVGATPRCVFKLAHVEAEIWCISDLLDDLPAAYQSSTEKKAERLGSVSNGAAPALVIAVGTAGYPSLDSENGSVVVGSQVFLHDGHPAGSTPNPVSQWHEGPFDEVVGSSLDCSTFDGLLCTIARMSPALTTLFLSPPLNPSPSPKLIASYDCVALGSMNVTDPQEYERQDQATLDAFASSGNESERAKSLDTTLGLVRVKLNAPFLFVAGIVNRVGYATTEMVPRSYAQNLVGAHNAAAVAGRLVAAADCLLM